MLFIDEIHRLNPAVEEILYPAMEDFQLDLIIGEGPAARSVRIDLAKFTLIGATTRTGLLTTPLRDRFGIPVRLDFYTEEELLDIIRRGARVLQVAMAEEGAREIARRSRGTPRIAGRLLRRVRDFASVAGSRNDRCKRRRQGAAQSRGRQPRPRCARPPLSQMHRRQFRRRAGRRRHHRRLAVGSARCDRGSDRAVPDPAGLRQPHAARPHADAACLPAISGSRCRSARRSPRASCRSRATMTERGRRLAGRIEARPACPAGARLL